METLLFIGDSITDSHRFQDPQDIGYGYVRLIRDYLKVSYPDQCLQVVNKGISGDHIKDLVPRWKQDVIDQNPAYLSICIGINDVWSRLDNLERESVDPVKYEDIFCFLLDELKERTKAKIILMEPTIHGEEISSQGNKLLAPYVEVVRKLAVQYDAVLVPTHQAFLEYFYMSRTLVHVHILR